MASYANFHHVELDGITGRKSTPRPVGGRTSIFDSSPEPVTPRKVKDYQKSNPLGLGADGVDHGKKFDSPPRSKQGSPTPSSQSQDDVSDTCSEASTSSSIGTPVKTPRSSRPPPGGFAHKLW